MARHANKHDMSFAALATDDDDDIRPGTFGVEWNLPNIIDAGGGNDTIMGGGFADTINAGPGDDIIDGGRAPDVIDGGDGFDTVRIHSSLWSLDVDGQRQTIINVEALDLSNITHQFDSDGDGIIDASRDLLPEDMTFDGTVLHVSVVENDPRWDAGVIIIGVLPELIV